MAVIRSSKDAHIDIALALIPASPQCEEDNDMLRKQNNSLEEKLKHVQANTCAPCGYCHARQFEVLRRRVTKHNTTQPNTLPTQEVFVGDIAQVAASPVKHNPSGYAMVYICLPVCIMYFYMD